MEVSFQKDRGQTLQEQFRLSKKTIMVLDKKKMLSPPRFEKRFRDAICSSVSGCGLIDAAIAREVPRNAKSIDEAHFISM